MIFAGDKASYQKVANVDTSSEGKKERMISYTEKEMERYWHLYFTKSVATDHPWMNGE